MISNSRWSSLALLARREICFLSFSATSYVNFSSSPPGVTEKSGMRVDGFRIAVSNWSRVAYLTPRRFASRRLEWSRSPQPGLPLQVGITKPAIHQVCTPEAPPIMFGHAWRTGSLGSWGLAVRNLCCDIGPGTCRRSALSSGHIHPVAWNGRGGVKVSLFSVRE